MLFEEQCVRGPKPSMPNVKVFPKVFGNTNLLEKLKVDYLFSSLKKKPYIIKQYNKTLKQNSGMNMN